MRGRRGPFQAEGTVIAIPWRGEGGRQRLPTGGGHEARGLPKVTVCAL